MPSNSCNDVRFVQNVFGGFVGSLRVGLLGGHVLGFRLGIALLLLLRQQIVVGLRALQRVLRFLCFAGRGGAFLLQAFECFQVALCRVALGAGFDDLRLQRQNFFLRSTVLRFTGFLSTFQFPPVRVRPGCGH